MSLARRFHIGDTPMDLQAAEGAGAQGVGVTTGVYTREELKAVSPGARNSNAVIALCAALPFVRCFPSLGGAVRTCHMFTGIVPASATHVDVAIVHHDWHACLVTHCDFRLVLRRGSHPRRSQGSSSGALAIFGLQ